MTYTYRIQYYPTKHSVYADAPSWLPKAFDDVFEESENPEECQVNQVNAGSLESLSTLSVGVINAT